MIHPNSTLSYNEQRKKGRTTHFRKAIFDLFDSTLSPLTDRQCMDALGEPEVNNIRPEITRLKEDGLIAECGKVRCPVTGKTVRQSVTTGKPYFPRHKPSSATSP